jgi:hypothetical protein
VLKVHEKPGGRIELLTKGDNNRVDDRGLYAPGQQFIGREDILGRAGDHLEKWKMKRRNPDWQEIFIKLWIAF